MPGGGLPPLLPPRWGLCPELPAKHRFNSADKSPSRNHHPQHSGRDEGGKNLLQNPSRRAAGGCAGTSAPGLSAQSRGSLSAGTGAPVTPRQRGSVLPARWWDGVWWLTAAASPTPGQTGEETRRQAPGCARVPTAPAAPLWGPHLGSGLAPGRGASTQPLCGAEWGQTGPFSCRGQAQPPRGTARCPVLDGCPGSPDAASQWGAEP